MKRKPMTTNADTKRIYKRKSSSDDYELGMDLIWIEFPKQDHAAWPIFDKPASSEGKIWVRWESTGGEEEISRDRIRTLTKDRTRDRRQRVSQQQEEEVVHRPAPAVPLSHRKRIIQALLSLSSSSRSKKKKSSPSLSSSSSVPPKRPRKNPHPQPWPQIPYSEAVVQSRGIQLGDFVHRNKELFRVTSMACFYHHYKRVFRDLIQLVNVKDPQHVVYEDKENAEPGIEE